MSMATTTTQRDSVQFTDEKIEVGIIIRVFLDAIYNRTLDEVGREGQANLYLGLIDFAKKWETQVIMSMIEVQVELHIRRPEGYDLFDLFLLTVKIQSFELAAECLRLSASWSDVASTASTDDLAINYQSDEPLPNVLEPIPGASVFDLSASEQESFLSLPPTIVLVLLRASRLAKEKSQDQRPYETRFGDEFLEIMRKACKCHHARYACTDSRPAQK
jgi:hypothetical protein